MEGTINSSLSTVYITDNAGLNDQMIGTTRIVMGDTFEFQDYAILVIPDMQTKNKYCGKILDGMSWGFQEKTVEVGKNTNVQVYQMLPFKALGTKSSPELNPALEKYRQYWHDPRAIVYS